MGTVRELSTLSCSSAHKAHCRFCSEQLVPGPPKVGPIQQHSSTLFQPPFSNNYANNIISLLYSTTLVNPFQPQSPLFFWQLCKYYHFIYNHSSHYTLITVKYQCQFPIWGNVNFRVFTDGTLYWQLSYCGRININTVIYHTGVNVSIIVII